jgi:hypothetical protein
MVQGEPFTDSDRSIYDSEVLTTVDSTTHDGDDIEDPDVLSPPASPDVDDVDEGDFGALTEDKDLQPQPLDYGEEELDGDAIEEYPGHRNGDTDVDDAIGEIDARVQGRVCLPTVVGSDAY